MANPQPENKVPNVSQVAKAKGNVTQYGGNITNTTNISFFLIGVLALGGLAWALNFAGSIRGSGNPQQAPQPSPASTK